MTMVLGYLIGQVSKKYSTLKNITAKNYGNYLIFLT
jgi:hypothetical protein